MRFVSICILAQTMPNTKRNTTTCYNRRFQYWIRKAGARIARQIGRILPALQSSGSRGTAARSVATKLGGNPRTSSARWPEKRWLVTAFRRRMRWQHLAWLNCYGGSGNLEPFQATRRSAHIARSACKSFNTNMLRPRSVTGTPRRYKLLCDKDLCRAVLIMTSGSPKRFCKKGLRVTWSALGKQDPNTSAK